MSKKLSKIKFGRIEFTHQMFWVRHSDTNHRFIFSSIYRQLEILPGLPLTSHCPICNMDRLCEYVCRNVPSYIPCCNECAGQIYWIIEYFNNRHPLLKDMSMQNYITGHKRDERFLQAAESLAHNCTNVIKCLGKITPPELARAISGLIVDIRCKELRLDKTYLALVAGLNI